VIKTIEEDVELKIENPDEIIVENIFSHLSAGTEMACVAGIESWFPLPNTPGYTSVGRILEKGANVNHVKIDDIVYTFGPHASHFKVNVKDRFHGVCVNVPKGLEYDLASFTHMGGIALTSIRASQIELGDVVAVSGLGTIGNLAAQFAQLQGATVIAGDINNKRIKIAEECGIKYLLNVNEKGIEEFLNNIGMDKVDCWIDASGQSSVIEQSLNHIKNNGEMILLGSPRSEYKSNLTDTYRKIHLLEAIRLKSALEFTFPTHQNDFNKHSIERNSRIIMDLMIDEKIKIKPIYSHLLKPEEASKAYLGLRDNPEEFIGVVFDWS
jgi:hypothetical protein